MNPAVPLLAVLGVGGLLVLLRFRREAGLAWGVLAVAGMALLAPALSIPDGIPSPAATLSSIPPWQGTGDPAGGNPVLRDVTFQIQPWQLFARRELREGRLPFWNPHQFSGAPFWSNGQSAPLFPLHLLFAALPLQIGFVLLPWLRLLIAGCGAWVLGRELGLSRPGALVAAVMFGLSGMVVSFLLFPMGNALALVPWVLWSVEVLAGPHPRPLSRPHARTPGRGGRDSANLLSNSGSVFSEAGMSGSQAGRNHLPLSRGSGWADGRGGRGVRAPYHGALLLALLAGLQLLGGHPETSAHTALLSAVYLLVRGTTLAGWGRFVLGWIGAALLAAVHILPLALLLPETSKWTAQGGGGHPPFALLLEQPLRLVLPQLYGHPAEGTWWGPFNYSATAVYAGALALPLAAAGLARVRERRWLAVAVLLGFSFLAAYHWPGLREVLGALPVLGKAAHHRLIFGIELGLALLAGAGCDRWLAGKGRGIAAGAAVVAVLLGASWLVFSEDWSARGLLGQQIRWTVGALALALVLTVSLKWSRERRWSFWPLLPAIALLDLVLAHGGILGAIPLERLYPETGAVRFLQAQEGRVAGVGQALRPNAAMVHGLFDPRGDDPVKLERYEAVYRSFAPGDAVYFQPVERWDSPWLDRLGVRWVVAGPEQAVPGRLAYQGADARVYERPGALPIVRWSRNVERLMVTKREPGFWEIGFQTPSRDTLVVAETWDRGWSASVEGRPVPVVAVEGALLGVELGPGEGRVELRYRPPGLVAGAALSLIVLLVLGVLWVLRRRRPPPRPSPASRERETPALEIRPTRPEDLASLSALFADRFGHSLEPDEWEWKYRHIPGEARSFVAVQGGEVVAHAGALCLPARWQGGEAGIWQLVDFVGTPRRGGLRPALVDLGRELLHDLPREGDVPWIFGFPSERHFRLGQRVFGYKPLLELETFSGVIPEGSSEARIETGDSGGEWASRIWERCGVQGVRRSDDFLRWRYWSRPRRYYRFYRLFSGGEEGLAVFAFVGEEAWAAELWLPSSGEWYPSLLAVAADLRASGLRSWKFWSVPGLEDLYRDLGLEPEAARRFVGCRGDAVAGFTWSMGDYDLA